VLGRLISNLRKTGLYDKALLVVTADHGISFRAREKRRPLSEANLQDIAYVPLFVKLPHQQHGRVDRAPARTLDILPTIAAAAGVRIPWRVDGRSLLGKRTPERDVVLVKDAGKRFVVPAAELEARRERALQRQLKLFGSAEPMSSLYAVGPGRGSLNHSIQGRSLDAQLDDIDRSSDPVQVSGVVPGATRAVAVVVGGKIVAVAPAASGRFWALVPRARLGAAKPLIYAIQARS
jgi:arylsulfatase A-like enzyme